MKTTININGLPVEFTDEVPTRAGDYYAIHARLKSTIDDVSIIRVDEKCGVYMVGQLHHFNYLWSAPLVPVTEVEKAWEDGVSSGIAGGSAPVAALLWRFSNARKVVEGCK